MSTAPHRGWLLTPERLALLQEAFDDAKTDREARWPTLIAECPYETRLAIAAWVMRAIVDHATTGGGFRHLIYSRLGFDQDAYVPLQLAGGLTISNEFDLSQPPGTIRH